MHAPDDDRAWAALERESDPILSRLRNLMLAAGNCRRDPQAMRRLLSRYGLERPFSQELAAMETAKRRLIESLNAGGTS